MKKVLTGIIALFLLNVATMAQAVKQAPSKATESKMKVVAAKPVAAVKPAATTVVVLKKDGTPDKRYNNAATAVPLKKDGTPDKRFKACKKS